MPGLSWTLSLLAAAEYTDICAVVDDQALRRQQVAIIARKLRRALVKQRRGAR